MYGNLEGVYARIPTVGVLSTSTTPTEAQVDAWMEEGSAILNLALASAGYATDVAESAAGYRYLAGMAETYAAALALKARGIDSMTGMDENSSETMLKNFWMQVKLLGGGNLEALGMTLLATAPRNRRMRSRQLRRIDGYSATYEGSATAYEYPSE